MSWQDLGQDQHQHVVWYACGPLVHSILWCFLRLVQLFILVEIIANSSNKVCVYTFKMGARHSARRDLSFNNIGGAGDGTSAAGKSTHRSSASYGKLRRRWSKVARSHSDRTPVPLSTATNGSRDYLQAEGCSSRSISCQTEVQSVSVMTQTERDGLLGWKVIEKDRCYVTFDSPWKELDIGSYSNFDSSQKSQCEMSVDSKLHCLTQDSLGHVRLVEAKSCPCDKENYSFVANSEDHVKEQSCSNDAKFSHQSGTVKHLPSETDRACNTVENFMAESVSVQELSSVDNVQRQITRTSVCADMTKQPDKRKQSYVSETKSMTENAIDLGSSFGSLNSEDMMLDSETDHIVSPSNTRSRHSSVDAGPLTHPRRVSGRLMNSKYTAMPECDQVQHSSSEASVGRKYSARIYGESVGSPKHSESAVIDDDIIDIKDTVNGWCGMDAVTKLSAAEALSRFIVLLVSLALTSLRVLEI